MSASPAFQPEELQVQVDEDILDLVPEFLARRREDLRELEGILERRDIAAGKSLGHNLAGSGAGYGFQVISRLGREIETNSGADWTRVREAVDRLAEYLEQVRYE